MPPCQHDSIRACSHANRRRNQPEGRSRQDHPRLTYRRRRRAGGLQHGADRHGPTREPPRRGQNGARKRHPLSSPRRRPPLPGHSREPPRMAPKLAVIDTPPLAEAEARVAAKAADLVLVPCRPNAFDLHSIRTTTDLTRFAAKPAFAVFNAGPVAAARLYAETTELVTEIGLQVAPVAPVRAGSLSSRDRKWAGRTGDRAARESGRRGCGALALDMPAG